MDNRSRRRPNGKLVAISGEYDDRCDTSAAPDLRDLGANSMIELDAVSYRIRPNIGATEGRERANARFALIDGCGVSWPVGWGQ